MLNEPSDLEVMRLIAYVSQIDLPEDEEDYQDFKSLVKNKQDESDEYLIDFVTVEEALKIGNEGLLNKVASTLVDKDILKHPAQSITWRLVRPDQQTPNEKKLQDNYQITDLRSLH